MPRGPISQQAHDVVMTSIISTSCAHLIFNKSVPNNMITFLILKSDIIENSWIELRGIVLPVLQIKLKLHLLFFYPSTWYICDFFLFHIEIEGKGGWIIGGGGGGGGGGKGYVGPPLKLLGGGGALAPCPLFLRL